MEPDFKNDREILLAVWNEQQTLRKYMAEHQEQASRFQEQTRQDINTLKIDVAILKERKKSGFNFGKLFAWIGSFFGFIK